MKLEERRAIVDALWSIAYMAHDDHSSIDQAASHLERELKKYDTPEEKAEVEGVL